MEKKNIDKLIVELRILQSINKNSYPIKNINRTFLHDLKYIEILK